MFYLQVYFVNTEKDAQLITLIIIVNRSVWLLCTVKVAPKFILFFLLRLYYFHLLYGTVSLSWPHPLPPPPLFSFLKMIKCLAVTFNFGSKCGTKDRHWCKQNVVFNVWICTPNLDDLRHLHPLSPEEAPQTSRWGVNHRDAHAYLQLFGKTSGLRWKRSTSCIVTFVSSSLKEKMHFRCQPRR